MIGLIVVATNSKSGAQENWSDWPEVGMEGKQNEDDERFVDRILSLMTDEEKVYQMVQPALNTASTLEDSAVLLGPGDQMMYGFGSWLNGGGGWPGSSDKKYHGIKYNKDSDLWESDMDWDCTIGSGGDEFCRSLDTTSGGYSMFMEKFHIANEAYWQKRSLALGEDIRIPFFYATDAVHGHNNLKGATLFPHNIGLGAADDASMMRDIGNVTAREVASCGMDWTFAPCVVTPRDNRWGRVYEGYSEDGEIVYKYAKEMVKGIQGESLEILRTDDTKIVSNIKHWVGDGGTMHGVDRGENWYSESDLINIHAPGYFGGLESNAQIVMTSFNSWHNTQNYDNQPEDNSEYNYSLHGSQYILRDVLKGKMGFDGVVVTDWAGHALVDGCSPAACSKSVLAGNDIIMLPDATNWHSFSQDILDQMKSKDKERAELFREVVDDAVRRILRVKRRAGLWDKPSPLGIACYAPENGKCQAKGCSLSTSGSTQLVPPSGGESECGRSLSRKAVVGGGVVGSDEHIEVARSAVQKSMVLMKNNKTEGTLALPLRIDNLQSKKVVIQGSVSNNWAGINGGWTISWQGGFDSGVDASTSPDSSFSSFIHPAKRICDVVEANGGSCVWNDPLMCDLTPDKCACDSTTDICFNFIGEKAYAEMRGDIFAVSTLDFAEHYPEDAALLNNDAALNITFFFSGRALYANDLINKSDAFVAAFLPGAAGSEAFTDLVFGTVDFSGRLSTTWPKRKCDASLSRYPHFATVNGKSWTPPKFETDLKIFEQDELKEFAPFNYGYGLTFASSVDMPDLPLDLRDWGCLVPNPNNLPELPDTAEHTIYRSSSDLRDLTPFCASYADQFADAYNKKCNEIGEEKYLFLADCKVDQLKCGFDNPDDSSRSLDAALLSVTEVTEVDGNKLSFKSLFYRHLPKNNKEVILMANDSLSDLMTFYGDDAFLTMTISTHSLENICEGQIPEVGVGMQWSPNKEIFVSYEFSQRAWFDIGRSLNVGEKAVICLPLKHLNPTTPMQDWYRVSHEFFLSTRASAQLDLENIRILDNNHVDKSNCTDFLTWDQAHFYPSYAAWRDRELGCEV